MLDNKCERCKQQTATRIMSMFNVQMICTSCKEREQNDPRYKEAERAELEAIKQGNFKFKGIGWLGTLLVLSVWLLCGRCGPEGTTGTLGYQCKPEGSCQGQLCCVKLRHQTWYSYDFTRVYDPPAGVTVARPIVLDGL